MIETKKKRKEIEAANEEVIRKRKKEALKEIKSKIKTKIKQLDEEKLNEKVKQIEKCKNDSTGYYAAMKEIRKLKKLCVKDKDGTITATEEQQIKVITEHFKKMLSPTGKSCKEYRPHQKLGKKKGPPENLHPIILLSVIRKILTICMLDCTWNHLKNEIPLKQAAYQPGQSTTENVHAIKLLAEKAILSSDYHIYLLLRVMSKAFDTVDRKILFGHLEELLDEDELYILHIQA